MGLDMYLSARKYMSKYSDPEKAAKIKEVFPEIPESENLDSVTVSFEVGYWRKANQIHKWFVDNVQNGIDNCKSYYVDRDQLIELKGVCKEVLENKNNADSLLPSESGFFFGCTEYDEWYFQDVEGTIEIIDKCLELPDCWDFKYQASW